MPPAGSETSGRNFELAGQLYNWVKASGLGVAFDSSAGFRLPNGAVRGPDASWVESDRWDALTPDSQERHRHATNDPPHQDSPPGV